MKLAEAYHFCPSRTNLSLEKYFSPMRSKCKSGKEAVKLPYIHTYIKDNPIDTHIHMNFTGTKKKHSELQLTLANAIPPIVSLIL